MHKRVYSFLEQKNCFYNAQFGFRLCLSTNNALMPMTENIESQLDQNKFYAAVFVHLKKAFDTVDHGILLEKLPHYGIRGIVNEWFCSYLTKRKQYVFIGNQVLNLNEISTGVPQGSVLGPLLFFIYINNLHKCMKYSKTYHFADDTSIIQSHSSLQILSKRINKDLSNLSNWLKTNKLSLNIKKTELVLFRPKKLKLDHSFKFKIDGKRLIPIHSVKYLGVLLDEHMSWNQQIHQIKLKLNRAIGILSKLRSHPNLNTLRITYYSLFQSHPQYGVQLWGQKNEKIKETMQKLQNHVLKKINFKKCHQILYIYKGH